MAKSSKIHRKGVLVRKIFEKKTHNSRHKGLLSHFIEKNALNLARGHNYETFSDAYALFTFEFGTLLEVCAPIIHSERFFLMLF